MSEVIERLVEVILTEPGSNEGSVRQGYARRFNRKVVASPNPIKISGR